MLNRRRTLQVLLGPISVLTLATSIPGVASASAVPPGARIDGISYPYKQYINNHSRMCLSIPKASTKSGVQIRQYTCANKKNFGWRGLEAPTGKGIIIRSENQLNPHEKCMAVKNGSEAPGAAVVTEPCNYHNTPLSQTWAVALAGTVIHPWYIFQNQKSLLCMKISGASKKNGGKLIQEPCIQARHTTSLLFNQQDPS
jgi:hypothetical protein